MGKVCSSGKWDKCEVTIIYSKYTCIDNQINWICTWLSSSWPDAYVFMELPIVIKVEVNVGEWVLKLKKSLYWLSQASKKLLWSSKDWSRKEGLTSISGWNFYILQKRISDFNLCWWLSNSLTQTKYNHIINWINK